MLKDDYKKIEKLDLYLADDEYVIPDVMLICDCNQIKKTSIEEYCALLQKP